tara:strand:- start:191 stop:793 length:603 start_codon:yes stop_codon:yes gene_type:complete
MRKIQFVIPIIIVLLFSCEKKITAEEFEQNILNEIFIRIVDSTYKDKRLYTCFPERGKNIYNKNGNWIGQDTTGQKRRDMDCELKKIALKKDTLNLIIAVGNNGLINDKTDLKKFNSQKFIFRHLSELPEVEDYANWETKYSKFAGAMFFSNIKFDHKKETGTLSVGYSCGGKCGLSYIVYIIKVNNKWIVTKVEQTGIS